MTTEQWQEYPLVNDVVSRSQFFDELRDNLKAVIRDYIGLGIENEAQLLAQADNLFSGEVVPSRQDWRILDALLHELANVKEIGPLYHDFFRDASNSLGVSDLANIRRFLDTIQTMPPREPSLRIELPVPNRPYLNKPTFSSTDDYMGNLKLVWNINSSSTAIKTASISGARSTSEDILHYDLTIEAGSGRWEKRFGPTDTITYSLPLTWTSWFAEKDLAKASLKATLTATDKRGNTSLVTKQEQYASNISIPTSIVKYEVQYQINNGGWLNLTTTAGTTHTWNRLPKIDGTYRFRVRGIDSLGRTYGGFEAHNNNLYTDWSYSNNLPLKYLPDPPTKPAPTYTSTWNTITIKWKACARAEYYEVHNWTNVATAKANSHSGNIYYKKVMANETLSTTLQKFSSDNWHGIYVRAVNAGGETVGYVACKTKPRVLRKSSYSTKSSRVWNGMRNMISSGGWRNPTASGPNWRDERNTLWQGEWKEVNLGGWRQRGGNGSYYMAYDGQTWGNHMSFIFFDYDAMRKQLKGKNIQKVSISLKRSTAGAHGFPEATPLYLYNHNRDDSWSTTVGNAFTLFLPHNRAAVNRSNQYEIAKVKFDRGETEKISNSLTKSLIQNIVDGHMQGLGIVYYYGNTFNANTTYSDKSYMRLSSNIKIEVEYYDD